MDVTTLAVLAIVGLTAVSVLTTAKLQMSMRQAQQAQDTSTSLAMKLQEATTALESIRRLTLAQEKELVVAGRKIVSLQARLHGQGLGSVVEMDV